MNHQYTIYFIKKRIKKWFQWVTFPKIWIAFVLQWTSFWADVECRGLKDQIEKTGTAEKVQYYWWKVNSRQSLEPVTFSMTHARRWRSEHLSHDPAPSAVQLIVYNIYKVLLWWPKSANSYLKYDLRCKVDGLLAPSPTRTSPPLNHPRPLTLHSCWARYYL